MEDLRIFIEKSDFPVKINSCRKSERVLYPDRVLNLQQMCSNSSLWKECIPFLFPAILYIEPVWLVQRLFSLKVWAVRNKSVNNVHNVSPSVSKWAPRKTGGWTSTVCFLRDFRKDVKRFLEGMLSPAQITTTRAAKTKTKKYLVYLWSSSETTYIF